MNKGGNINLGNILKKNKGYGTSFFPKTDNEKDGKFKDYLDFTKIEEKDEHIEYREIESQNINHIKFEDKEQAKSFIDFLQAIIKANINSIEETKGKKIDKKKVKLMFSELNDYIEYKKNKIL